MIGNKLEPFKFWCQKVLPNVYDDSLSYYEYLCKLNEYLNEVIEQINTLTDNMEDYESDLSAQWTAYKNVLNAEWAETKNYIDNYFNNLDVQQEINNKLDQMAQSGALSTLLAPIVGTQIGGVVASQIGGTVANQIDAVVASQIGASVGSQINEPVATAVNAWLTEHITPTTPAIDDTLSVSGAGADAKVTGNRLDDNDLNDGLNLSALNGERIIALTEHILYRYSDGSVMESNTNYRSTPLINIDGFKHVKVAFSMIANFCQIAYFDADKFYMQSASHEGTGNTNTIDEDIPSGAKYIAFSRYGSDIYTVKLTTTDETIIGFINKTIDTTDCFHYARYGGVTSPPSSIVDSKTRCYIDIKAPFRFNTIKLQYPDTLAETVVYVKVSGSWSLVSIPKNTKYNFPDNFEEFIACFRNASDETANITQNELNNTYIETISDFYNDIDSVNKDITDVKNSYFPMRANVMYGGWSIINEGADFYEADNVIRAKTYPLYTNVIGYNLLVTLPSTLTFGTVATQENNVWSSVSISVTRPTTLIKLANTVTGIRFSFRTPEGDEISEAELKGIKVEYIQNEYMNKILPKSHWIGKKLASLGDSITWGYIPRNYEGYPGQLKSFAQLTAEALGMTFANYGIVGSTVAYDADRNPMSRRYNDLPNDADIITVMGGTNDIRSGISLGTMNDRTDSTFYGALHVVFGGLYKKYMIDQGTTTGKTKHIIVLTPIKLLGASGGTEGGTGTLYPNFDLWAKAVKDVAEYYSFPCLDMYNVSGINPHLNETVHGTEVGYTDYYNPYITDGTHPTQEGAELMANALIGFIKSLD